MLPKTSPLSCIHPYPGMVADELAMQLAGEFVIEEGRWILDPFVGTGRFLAAAGVFGGRGIGFDINPLAIIIANAKASRPALPALRKLYTHVEMAVDLASYRGRKMFIDRKVEWFPKRTLVELQYLVDCLNAYGVPNDAHYLIGAILSATARQVSYCRKDQWKLHRLSESHRQLHQKSAFPIFLGRLQSAIRTLEGLPKSPPLFRALFCDSRRLQNESFRRIPGNQVDLILTSPPYGDSRTTVQYGGMSELCLDVISKLDFLKDFCGDYKGIDRACLGGILPHSPCCTQLRKGIWGGDIHGVPGRRLISFLADLEASCVSSLARLKVGGKAVFVVSRRSIDGRTLKLDKWLIDLFYENNCDLLDLRVRRLQRKIAPFLIRPKARSNDQDLRNLLVRTMREEYILIFQKRS